MAGFASHMFIFILQFIMLKSKRQQLVTQVNFVWNQWFYDSYFTIRIRDLVLFLSF